MTELTLQTLLDEAAIERVLVRYAIALDERDFGALDEVFLSEASACYQTIGDFDSRDAILTLLRGALGRCGKTQHLLGNYRITIDGDRATAASYLQAVHAGLGEYASQTMTLWGEYRDRLVRRPEGWRIEHRELAVFQMAGDIGPTALGSK